MPRYESTNAPSRRLAAVLVMGLVVSSGCQGDGLDPGAGIVGPVITLAPQTVSVSVAAERVVPLGGSLGVTVSAHSGPGTSSVASLGATALVLSAQGAVLHVVPVGRVDFDPAQQGVVTRELRLRPAAEHVRSLHALPDTLTYEIHAWALTAGGACAAAVVGSGGDAGQRLPCTELDGQLVARGTRGAAFQLVVEPPHRVGLRTTGPERMERDDVLTFTVTARTEPGLGGIREVGVSAEVTGAGGVRGTVLLARREVDGEAQVSRTITLTFAEIVEQLALRGIQLPSDRALTLDPSAYAVHETGSCVAAVENGLQQLHCVPVGAGYAAVEAAGAPREIVGVEGTTVAFPGGAMHVGDLVVHAASQRLFASNQAGHTVEVLSLGDIRGGFASNVAVGSRPRGMTLSADGSRLVVANSGGTNFSAVSLATLTEEQRIPITRYTLYQLIFEGDGVILEYFNYADRPQYVTQDAGGRMLYSAASTHVAPVGTIRAVERHPATGQWEARLLFPDGGVVTTPPGENRAVTGNPQAIAIANVDSMELVMAEDHVGRRYFTGEVRIYDHSPGRPDQPRASEPRLFMTPEQREVALAYFRNEFGSDIVIYEGYEWNFPESVAAADTAFVAASGDRQWVAFGEGVTTPAGRVVMWDAVTAALSRVEDIRDVLNNSSDRLGGLAMNGDGSLGVAHGGQGVYFFDRRLRLQGTGGTGLEGGAGVAFLPGIRQLVVAGTGRSSLQVIEPVGYTVVREIPIRSTIVGPLRAGPCAPGAPTDCMATVYGVTADGIVVVHVPG
jgi:hypothetical protein